jgi:hypothetical protein
MSEQPQSPDRDSVSPRQRLQIATAFAGQPASFWFASLASLGLIVGGIGPWATAYGFLSVSGTSMHGWREVMVGVLGLAMLGLHQLRGARVALIIAGIAGVLGAIQAIDSLGKINSGGAVSFLGHQYRYVDPAWGLYLVFTSALVLVCAAAVLTWRASRAKR